MSVSALDQLKAYLGNTIRIRISDGRVIEGIFDCMDKDLNFILSSAVEYHNAQSDDFSKPHESSRNLGMAMIPGPHVVSCKVMKELST